MSNLIYTILILTFCSCGKKVNTNADNAQQSDSLHDKSIINKSDISLINPFLDNSLFSNNATSSNKYGDTIFSYDIDTFLKNYLSDRTTYGDMETYYYATQKLDTLIEKVYIKIYQKLRSEHEKYLFKTSQDNWIRYFESETNLLHYIYWSKQTENGFGREHSITQAQWTFQIARQRLILLKNIDEQTYTDEEIN